MLEFIKIYGDFRDPIGILDVTSIEENTMIVIIKWNKVFNVLFTLNFNFKY